jgi:hypothetical protein
LLIAAKKRAALHGTRLKLFFKENIKRLSEKSQRNCAGQSPNCRFVQLPCFPSDCYMKMLISQPFPQIDKTAGKKVNRAFLLFTVQSNKEPPEIKQHVLVMT